MVGSWKWNMVLGVLAFILSFIFSLEHNTYFISLMRSCYSFVFFFLLGYLPRFLFARLASPQESQRRKETTDQENGIGEETPEDEFQPLTFDNISKTSQIVQQWSNE